MDVRGVALPLSAALLFGLLGGCGSGNDTIGSATADDLHRQVEAVRQAAADGRTPAALSAAADLRSTIRRLADAGELNPDDSKVLLTQIDRIASRVEARATPTPTPTPEPVSEPVDNGPADEGKDPGKAKGKDKKK